VFLDVGNNDILDSGVGSIGSVAMSLWGKLVFLCGRGGVVPAAALVGLPIVPTAPSPSAVALASSSVASSSTPVEWGSSSVIAVAAAHGAIRFGCSCSSIDFNGLPRREPLWYCMSMSIRYVDRTFPNRY
jgi:hypothetical protein